MNGTFWLCVGLTVLGFVTKSSGVGYGGDGVQPGWHSDSRRHDLTTPYQAFVGNIPWSADELSLEYLFEEATGQDVSVSMPRDRTTRRPKGFANVYFHDASALATAVSKMDHTKYLGREITVIAVPSATP